MSGAPFAPWTLRGEAIVGFARRRGRAPRQAPGLAGMPGPALIAATRYTSSPVGPYLELMVAVPARLGLRLGWCATTVITNQQDARIGGRLNWGFPTELGRLFWCSHDDERELVWEDRDLVVRGIARGFRVPLATPTRTLQQRGDGPVVVPGRTWGRLRLARVTVQVFPGDDLAWLSGRHPGVLVSGLHQVVREARHPSGLTATLRAPSRAPEPVLRDSWEPERQRQLT
jgi:hypothetical protein